MQGKSSARNQSHPSFKTGSRRSACLPCKCFVATCCLKESSGNDATSEHAAVEYVPLTVTVSRMVAPPPVGGEEPYQRQNRWYEAVKFGG